MGILSGITLGFSLLLLLALIDVVGAKATTAVGVVLGRRHVARRRFFVMVGKVMVPTVQPEQFILSVQGERGPVSVSTDPATHATVVDGEQVSYHEKRGLLTCLVYARSTPKPANG